MTTAVSDIKDLKIEGLLLGVIGKLTSTQDYNIWEIKVHFLLTTMGGYEFIEMESLMDTIGIASRNITLWKKCDNKMLQHLQLLVSDCYGRIGSVQVSFTYAI